MRLLVQLGVLLLIANAACKSRQGAGELCGGDHGMCDLGKDLWCSAKSKTCVDEDVWRAELKVMREKEAASERARMLAESGVEVEPEAPQVPSVPQGTRGAVRMVSVSGKGTVFAACRKTERLLSGGCKNHGTGTLYSSYPSTNSAGSTIGGQWNCERAMVHPDVQRSQPAKIEAFAVCETVGPAPQEP